MPSDSPPAAPETFLHRLRSLPVLAVGLAVMLLSLLGVGAAVAQEDVLRSVVALPATQPAEDQQSNRRDPFAWSIGASAVVVDHQGTLLTLEEALPADQDSIEVVIPGGPRATARVLRRSSSDSSAVLLRLDDPELISSLTPLTIGDSRQLSIGTTVWTVGNAFNALEQDGSASLSRGHISGIYDIPPGPPVRGRGGNILSTYRGPVFEVTAAVNDGNQGGALVDSSGQLIGLVSMGVSRDRKVGTAVPIHHLLQDLEWEFDWASGSSDSDPRIAELATAAQRVAESMTLVYFQRPDGPGNPRGLPRPTATIDDDTPGYRRRELQRQWDRYHHVQQVFYTDQAVTAVVVDAEEGLLLTSLTNLHGNAREGYLVDHRLEGSGHQVEVIGIDVSMDLALLQSEGPLPLPAAPFAWTPDLAAGDPIAALGRHRDGGDFTMTSGVISAVGRTPPGTRVAFVQIDALVNYGNLGGPIINSQGEVVALVTLLNPRSPWLINSGVGMATDAANIKRSLSPMQHLGGDLGRSRPGLGVQVDENMAVVQIVPDSGAAQGGVRRGDVLLAIDDAPMEDLYDLRGLLAGRAVGDALVLRIERNGEQLDLEITLGVLE